MAPLPRARRQYVRNGVGSGGYVGSPLRNKPHVAFGDVVGRKLLIGLCAFASDADVRRSAAAAAYRVIAAIASVRVCVLMVAAQPGPPPSRARRPRNAARAIGRSQKRAHPLPLLAAAGGAH